MGAPAPRLRDQAWEGFAQSVMAGTLRPGQFISQRQLVEITGFPLGAIRELVPRLEAEGLIRTVPQRGLQVPQADLTLVRNAFQFREILEVAAVRSYAMTASPAELAGLRRAHLAILARHEAGETDAALMQEAEAVDLSLHETVIGALGNDIVASAARVNWIKIKLIRLAETRLYVPMIPQVVGEHIGILDALDAGDGEAAAQAMARHIDTARRRALGV